jgi:hypothetical protein
MVTTRRLSVSFGLRCSNKCKNDGDVENECEAKSFRIGDKHDDWKLLRGCFPSEFQSLCFLPGRRLK